MKTKRERAKRPEAKPKPAAPNPYRRAAIVVFVLGAGLRLLLCWVNPPLNSFDDHFSPIFLIMKTGTVPAKNACFECYHPPVFYYLSAMIGNVLSGFATDPKSLLKPLQFVNCLYSILTLPVLYLILGTLRVSEFSRLVAFGTMCFLPRAIYMSAIHSNDGLSYLAVATCAYLAILAVQKRLPWPLILSLSVAICLAIYVKYTAFVVLPMVTFAFALLLLDKSGLARRKVLAVLAVVLLPALALLAMSIYSNFASYGAALSANLDPAPILKQPHDAQGIRFTSFTPWIFLPQPFMAPGRLHSFWTVVYSSTWIDNEPKFTYFTDKDDSWWNDYFAWLRGTKEFPVAPPPLSVVTRALSAGRVLFGLLPLSLAILGFAQCLRLCRPGNDARGIAESAKAFVFPIMVLFNAAGIIWMTLQVPVPSYMKASYFLVSMPAAAAFVALGTNSIEGKRSIRMVVACAVGALAGLSIADILRIASSLAFGFGA
jgi:4-amino-4-deoxy-L-arabinose transferase-like glycosyltransferase